jgi:hypothetical protein
MSRLGFVLVLVMVLGGFSGISRAADERSSCKEAGKRIEAGEADTGDLRDFAESCVRLNQVQVLGTHNSYHVEPAPSLDLLFQSSPPPGPTLSLVWDYTHAALAEQLSDQGIRQVEIDVFLDPDGGLYANPLGDILVAINGLPADPDPEGKRLEPGFQVLHVQDLDFRSTCLTLPDCLHTIQEWSSDNPRHLPVMVMLELKDEVIPDSPGLPPFVVPVLYTAEDLDDLDSLVRSVFPARQLITPDDIRGNRKTLEEAVLKDGWPTLEEARGRILFALDNGGEIRDLYVDGHASLAGRVLFVNSAPGQPEAAFMKRNDPVGQFAEISNLVAEGYIVRTRADSDTIEARFGVTARRDMALMGGAQFVSTDYPVPDPDFGTGYFVEIPDGAPGRCNPVNSPAGCRNEALESLEP